MRRASISNTSNTDPFSGKRLVEPYANQDCFVVQNPPSEATDSWRRWTSVYALPYHADTAIRPYDGAGRRSGHPGSKVQPGQQPGLLWRLQLLRPDLPSGTDHPGQKPRIPDQEEARLHD